MIFIQLVKNKNVIRNIGTYISLLSLVCSTFGIIEIKLIGQSANKNCPIEGNKGTPCKIVSLQDKSL